MREREIHRTATEGEKERNRRREEMEVTFDVSYSDVVASYSYYTNHIVLPRATRITEMDQSNENYSSKSCRKAISLLQGDEVFFNKLISRDSSMGVSSHFYFRALMAFHSNGNCNLVHQFIHLPPHADLLPPLSPPPAALAHRSFGGVANRSNGLISKVIWFWNKKKRINNYKRSQERMECGIEAGRVGPSEIWSSDGSDSVTTPRDLWGSSSASSSSLVGSFDGCDSPRWSGKRVNGFGLGPELVQSCSPWSLGRVLACVTRV
ncbi:hypothetical protein Syun_024915 [Stephania yunnanensis]|uniref:Uncharacterized protein n=1 Tax=Stephania yunnanensis TaxID=152371 RepID=A0AAP0EQN1_9MAGN